MEIFLLIFGSLLTIFGGIGYFSNTFFRNVQKKFWETDAIRKSALGLDETVRYAKFKAGISLTLGVFILGALLLNYLGIV